MKTFTKYLSLILTVMLLIASFAACSSDNGGNESSMNTDGGNTPENVTVRVAGMTGPTGIGLVKMKNDNEGNDKYTFDFYAAGSEVVAKLAKGEVDIAALPANLAAVNFNKNNEYIQVLTINTLGVLSILEKGDSIKSVAGLKGKTILAPASGKGATPEYALNYILTQNGIDPKTDVTIEWKSEVTEIIAALKTGAASIAMLPQPAATNAKNNVEGLNTALDFNDEWNKIGGDSLLVTGVTVVRKAFAEAHPELVSAFLTEYEASTKYANENVAETAKLVAKYNIAAEAVALAAIPYCNISCIKGTEMKTALSAYLKTLYDENPSSVGGKMPSDSFYYNEK